MGTSLDLAEGKRSFQNGEYKKAFRQLLPVAVKGKPDAEYAVGYMYFYGYGVPMDPDSGVFWMQQAAAQCYPPAIHALGLIHEAIPTPVVPAYPIQVEPELLQRQRTSMNSPRDSVMQTLPQQVAAAQPAAQTEKPLDTQVASATVPAQNKLPADLEAQRPQVASAPEPIQGKALPIMQDNHVATAAPASVPAVPLDVAVKKQLVAEVCQAPDYSLQVFGSYELQPVKDLQAKLHLTNTSHIYRTTHEGKEWYVLTFGNFASAHEASATKKNLPDDLRKLDPWVRNTNQLAVV